MRTSAPIVPRRTPGNPVCNRALHRDQWLLRNALVNIPLEPGYSESNAGDYSDISETR
jgi:hypothetical protein